MKLNLGAGNKPLIGYENYDINPKQGVKRIDLETDKLPHEENSVDEILMEHTLEHIGNIKHVMNECHRVLKPGGQLMVEVPRFPHEDSVKDPTHVRFFVPETFKYFEYDKTTEMYGFERWRVVNLNDTTEHVIKVILRPEK